ncbi:unnamed protein product [Owenia fusiformis]|uniref:Uncharacterized protein n=1 Tax=Owenia fusiformis TaxID=6347 RepID=A0A8J1TMV1_OWEFU|nr:unnamed protein product [Owenia fusiformis]
MHRLNILHQGCASRTPTPYFLQCIVICAALTIVSASNLFGADIKEEKSLAALSSSVDYLSKFGYLPPLDLTKGELRTEKSLVSAIEVFQRFANLPVTGQVNQQTLDQMTKPRCGMPDLVGTSEQMKRRKRYALARSKWDKTDLTYRFLNYSPDLDREQIRSTIARAFNYWAEVTPLTFTEIEDASEADIYISFRRGYHDDGYPFDGIGGVLAHAFFPGNGRGGDTHFDEDEPWVIDSSDGTDLFWVAVHEFGHALGLAHSSVRGSLMYPWYQGHNPNFKLHGDDIGGIQKLYGPNPGTHRTTPAPMPKTVKPTRAISTEVPYTVDATTPAVRTTTTKRAPVETNKPDRPDPCSTDFDAVAKIRGEVFMFKDNYFWRRSIRDATGASYNYPIPIKSFFIGLPEEFQSVDAVYEQSDYTIVFFKGDRYWKFDGNYLKPNFPKQGRPLEDFGLPSYLTALDAAFVWGNNGKTYFVRGRRFWRYDEYSEKIEYTKSMSGWKGVPVPIDAAFQFWDGRTYFFKGRKFYRFDDENMRVEEGYPQPSGPFWMDCREARPGQVSAATKQQISPFITVLSLVSMTITLIFTGML